MEITKVTYYDINNKGGNFLSKCSIVLDDCIALHDIRLFEGKKGRYIIMPTKSKDSNQSNLSMNKNSEDVFHPVNQSFFSYMCNIILDGFEEYENLGDYVYFP